MRTLDIKMTGRSPIFHHKDTLANPLDPMTIAHKQLTLKTKKTDVDHEAIAKSEWMGALYWNEKDGPVFPGENIRKALEESARLQKLGNRFKQAVLVQEDDVPMIYKGPREPEALFKAGFFDMRTVRVGASRIVRCRPKFNLPWALAFTVAYDESVVTAADIVKALEDGSTRIGVGDYRPRYGKYSFEVTS